MAARRYRGRRAIAVAVASSAIAVHLALAIYVWRRGGGSEMGAWALISRSWMWAPMAAMAALIALRGARRAGVAMLALAIGLIALDIGLTAALELWAKSSRPLFIAEVVTAFLAAGAFLRTPQLFPRQMTPSAFDAPNAPWLGRRRLRRLLTFMLRPWASWALALLWLAGTFVFPPAIAAASNLVIMLTGATFWFVRFRVGSKVDRSRVGWLLQWVLVAAVGQVISVGVGALATGAGAAQGVKDGIAIACNVVVGIGMVGSLAMAVFGAGAVNSSFVVRSTVVYGVAVSLLLFALNVATGYLVDSAADAFGLSDRLIAAVLGAVAGLLLEPVAKGLRRLMDRLARPRAEAS